MSDDKLVKSTVAVETAEAFAKAIGRAIADNDVESAQKLSGELRAKMAIGREASDICAGCLHRRDRHWLVQQGCIGDGITCGCNGFVDAFCDATVSSSKLPNLTIYCRLPAGHDGEHLNLSVNRRWTTSGMSQSLANTTNVKPARGPFTEGKHLARLRAVYYERSNSGRPYLMFRMNILKSRSMLRDEVTHSMPLERAVQAGLARSQLDRLGIDSNSINAGSPNLSNVNIDVMVVAVEKLTMKGVKIMSVNLRLLDDTDEDADLE